MGLGHFLFDPDHEEERAAQSVITLAYPSNSKQGVCMDERSSGVERVGDALH
jgi:hypothetical protein